jgi:hypothetical protein
MIEKADAERMMKAAEGAQAFERIELYERLIEIRVRDHDRFMRESSPATRLTLGYYEAAKRRAATMSEEAYTKG